MGNLEAAAAAIREAVANDRQILPPDHPRIASGFNSLVAVLWQMGDMRNARVNLEEAMEIRLARSGEDHPAIGVYLNNLGELDLALGNVSSAHQHLERSLEILQRAPRRRARARPQALKKTCNKYLSMQLLLYKLSHVCLITN